MTDVEIWLIHEGGHTERDRRCYEPGSTIRATVQLAPSKDVKCDRVLVRIGWHTEGRGDRDSAQVGEVELLRGTLNANTLVTRSFDFTLPPQPWSYAGHHINIIWEITVIIAIRFARDIKQTEQIVVAPPRPG